MRPELLVLAMLAAAALGALIDSARRAARHEIEDAPPGGPVPLVRAALEDLERARASSDDGGPRLLLGIALVATIAGAIAHVLLCAELTVVLLAVGVGLACPGLSWARDQRRTARVITARIAALETTLRDRA